MKALNFTLGKMVADGRGKSHSWHNQLAYSVKVYVFFEVFARLWGSSVLKRYMPIAGDRPM